MNRQPIDLVWVMDHQTTEILTVRRFDRLRSRKTAYGNLCRSMPWGCNTTRSNQHKLLDVWPQPAAQQRSDNGTERECYDS